MNSLLVGINAKYIHTNLAIRYLYTYTKDTHDVDFIEFTIKDDIENIIDKILSLNPSLIGFSCYIWNIELIKQLVKILKSKSSKIKILLGGPEVSYDINYWFNALPIDFIISGEGEYPFKKLLETLKSNAPFNKVPQLHYRHNQKIYTSHEEYVIDLDTLKSPYRIKEDTLSLPNRIQYIESSRGCPYRCSYCLASLEKHVRFFNIDTIKQEILYLMNHGGKVFKFLDRTFNARIDYALDLFEFIINNPKDGCVFQFEITGELLDEEIICYLNEQAPPHLIRFEIGIQSTNDFTNRLVMRKQNYQKLKHNIELIQQGRKIDLHLDLIAGLPKEDYTSFMKTFNDVFLLQPHELQLGFLKMLRGTKLRKDASLYQYTFHNTAPYEIIEHMDLSQSDIYKIHLAEDMLEKYYNSHRFKKSITYIINSYYKNNNYKFFENFGLFYYNHHQQMAYQVHDLCLRLLAFLENESFDTTHVQSLLIYDYLERAKTRPKIWYQTHLNKKDKHILFKYIVDNYQGYNFDLLFRYGLIEKLTIHPQTYEIGNYYLLKMFTQYNQEIIIFSIE
ncbi:DUF4080 domain-containing protein [Mycoplasmatota bacterium]|nr:DUF4080 domain-containing protein [Mycoplasmatota bacterium]